MKFFKHLLSPKYSYALIGKIMPWLGGIATLMITYGLIDGLFIVPPDYQQGDGFRIIYIHVPCAFLSLMIYAIMAIAALLGLVWRIKLADSAVIAGAPVGAMATLIALVTGSLWGKPMWGTWWVWDARLTSELILLFIYIAIMSLSTGLANQSQQARLRNIFVLIGSLNLPIIHYSVYWWNTLHQGATLSLTGPSHIALVMLRPLLAMIIGLGCLFTVVGLMRLRNLILWESRKSQWVKLLVATKNNNKKEVL
jgi:heme exporter protein C